MPPQRRSLSHPDEEEDDEMTMADAATTVLAIVKPVSLCMMLVIFIMSSIGDNVTSGFSNMMVYDEREHSSDSEGSKLTGALLNAGVFLVMIVVMTFILVLLYKYRCTKLIFGWMIFAVVMLLFSFGGQMWLSLFKKYNIPLDIVTFYFVMFNISVTGGITVFGYAPKRFVQGILVMASVMMVCNCCVA